ncbi:hypothetical protein AB9F26_13450 [Falsihalocynthiibacter sp. BN13B15]|uniref:hypothetical protein n=1 Tax=Falsihalocynthiibacter sp. BN13B15 TaxID=3240871 RepID=UPI00350FDFAC
MSLEEENKRLEARVAELEAELTKEKIANNFLELVIEGQVAELCRAHDLRTELLQMLDQYVVMTDRTHENFNKFNALGQKNNEEREVLRDKYLRAQKGLNAGTVANAKRSAEWRTEAERLRDICISEGKNYSKMLGHVLSGLAVWAEGIKSPRVPKEETLRKKEGFRKKDYPDHLG